MLENIDVIKFDHSGVISDDRKPVFLAGMLVLNKYGAKLSTFWD